MKILVSIAVRDSARPKEIRNVCWKLGRSYHDLPRKISKRRKAKGERDPELDEKMQRQIINNFKESLAEILKRKKNIWNR